MMSLSDDKQADVIDAFNTTSRYLDDILNINIIYFDNMVSQIYSPELQLNKANTSDTEAAFLDLHLTISNDIVSTKIYAKAKKKKSCVLGSLPEKKTGLVGRLYFFFFAYSTKQFFSLFSSKKSTGNVIRLWILVICTGLWQIF